MTLVINKLRGLKDSRLAGLHARCVRGGYALQKQLVMQYDDDEMLWFYCNAKRR